MNRKGTVPFPSPSQTQALQPDFLQPSEMRPLSAVEHEPDWSWRCSENCRSWRNKDAGGTSAPQAGAADTAWEKIYCVEDEESKLPENGADEKKVYVCVVLMTEL